MVFKNEVKSKSEVRVMSYEEWKYAYIHYINSV